MRIAFFSWEALHAVSVGSVSVHVWHLAQALMRAGHEVHLFTRQGPDQRLYDFIFGVHYHRCPAEPHENFTREIENLNKSFVHYFREAEVAGGRFDRLHCHDWLTATAGLKIREAGGPPLAITFHTTELGRTGNWPDKGDSRQIAELEKAAVQAAETVIAVSVETRRQLDMLYNCPNWKLSIIYHGIDLAPFDREPFAPGPVKEALGLSPMDPTVLFVGQLTFRKGPDLLVQAAPEVLKAHPTARFLLVGEGDLKDHLEKETARCGLSQSVCFLGWRGGQELTDLYRACDLVCVPSRSDPFGIVALSAWAAGKPVAATRHTGAGEFVFNEANGRLFAPEPSAVAETLIKLLEDFDHLRWLGRNGRVAVETAFTWDQIASQTLTAYDKSRYKRPRRELPE